MGYLVILQLMWTMYIDQNNSITFLTSMKTRALCQCFLSELMQYTDFFYLGLDAHDEMYFSDKLQQAIFVEVVSVSNFHLPQSNMLWKYLVEKSRNEKKKNPWLPDWMRCVSLMKSLLHPTPFRLRWQSCVPQPIPAVGESSLWIRP